MAKSGKSEGKKKGKAPKAGGRRGLLTSRAVGFVGLAALALIAYNLLRGELDVVAAATRAAVVFGVLVLTDRVLIPLARALIGTADRHP